MVVHDFCKHVMFVMTMTSEHAIPVVHYVRYMRFDDHVSKHRLSPTLSERLLNLNQWFEKGEIDLTPGLYFLNYKLSRGPATAYGTENERMKNMMI